MGTPNPAMGACSCSSNPSLKANPMDSPADTPPSCLRRRCCVESAVDETAVLHPYSTENKWRLLLTACKRIAILGDQSTLLLLQAAQKAAQIAAETAKDPREAWLAEGEELCISIHSSKEGETLDLTVNSEELVGTAVGYARKELSIEARNEVRIHLGEQLLSEEERFSAYGIEDGARLTVEEVEPQDDITAVLSAVGGGEMLLICQCQCGYLYACGNCAMPQGSGACPECGLAIGRERGAGFHVLAANSKPVAVTKRCQWNSGPLAANIPGHNGGGFWDDSDHKKDAPFVAEIFAPGANQQTSLQAPADINQRRAPRTIARAYAHALTANQMERLREANASIRQDKMRILLDSYCHMLHTHFADFYENISGEGIIASGGEWSGVLDNAVVIVDGEETENVLAMCYWYNEQFPAGLPTCALLETFQFLKRINQDWYDKPGPWCCTRCTFENGPTLVACEMCEATRPDYAK